MLEKDSNAKRDLQYGMSCSKEPWIITKYLNLQLNDSVVRKQDAISGLRYSLSHPSSFIHAYDFIKAKWNDILNKYAGFSFSYLVSDIANKLKHENLLNEVKIILRNECLIDA
jgi:hypothetical protein